MTRIHKFVNLLAVGLPPAALIVAIILLWHTAIGPLELSILAVSYVVTALGITLGYHRLFTHRSFQTSTPVRAVLAIVGSMAVEGSVITWVADHRKHHAFTDQEGDPHSPHLAGPGLSGAVKGLWHAHCGWLFESVGTAERERYAKDLLKDPTLRAIDRLFPLWIFLTFAIPAAIGYAIGGTLMSALLALLWGGLVRVFLLHHVTWSINSVCHFFGRRRFEVQDESRNVFWLAPFSMGEAWHHNHHAFPTSAFHGLRLSERLADPTGLVIAGMEKVGLASNVVRISPERQAAKLAGAAHTVRTVAVDAATSAKLAAATAVWVGWQHLGIYGIYSAFLGGLLTLLILAVRKMPMPVTALKCGWVARLHDERSGVPYDIALAIAGLIIYPDTGVWVAASVA